MRAGRRPCVPSHSRLAVDLHATARENRGGALLVRGAHAHRAGVGVSAAELDERRAERRARRIVDREGRQARVADGHARQVEKLLRCARRA